MSLNKKINEYLRPLFLAGAVFITASISVSIFAAGIHLPHMEGCHESQHNCPLKAFLDISTISLSFIFVFIQRLISSFRREPVTYYSAPGVLLLSPLSRPPPL